jgi:hypothetical protein
LIDERRLADAVAARNRLAEHLVAGLRVLQVLAEFPQKLNLEAPRPRDLRKLGARLSPRK